MSIKQNIEKIRADIPSGVTLVNVSKTQPIEKLWSAYEAGERVFGESRPRELESKYNELPKDIEWHMIGSLQTNKVKYIAPFVNLIHSVDSERLLEMINREALKCGRVIDVLLEIFVAQESTKHGWKGDELTSYLSSQRCRDLKGVRIRGVMGMASFTDDREQVRREFKELNSEFVALKERFFRGDDDKFDTLSMGMSGDFRIAIEQGSTMVRVGSSIFN